MRNPLRELREISRALDASQAENVAAIRAIRSDVRGVREARVQVAGWGHGGGSNLRADPGLLRGLLVTDEPKHYPEDRPSKADLIPVDDKTGYLAEREAQEAA
jgi:hypothetical protein